MNLGDLIDRTKDGDALALVDVRDGDGDRQYSFAELDRLIMACARGLDRYRLSRGDAVGILAANSVEYLIAYYAVLRAGYVAVPINHKVPAETVSFILKDSKAKLVFCDRDRRHLVPQEIQVVQMDVKNEWDALLDPGDFSTVTPTDDEIAMILYTSGSSGRPKGVLLTHKGQAWAVTSRLRGGSFENERIIIAAPLFHMNALANAKFASAAHVTMVLMPQFDTKQFLSAIDRYRITWITGVPTMMAMVVRETSMLAAIEVSQVRYIRMGSAPATQKLFDDVKRAFPNASVVGGYGTTECGPVMFGPSKDGKAKTDMELGWPLPDVEVRLVNSDGEDADEGVLWIRTPANMAGYLNLPEKTAEVLRSDRWYISGDVFRRNPSGAFIFVGRADDMFVCGGENIYPGEVEKMLERHPEIRQACVLSIPDELKGAKPIAFVVLREGSELTAEEVKQYALANAPAYQHPRHVFFMKELPLAGTNKIDRKVLLAEAKDNIGKSIKSA